MKQKTMKNEKYNCQICNFHSCYKKNFTKHCNTIKYNKRISPPIDIIEKFF